MKHYRILRCNLFFQVFLISFLWTFYFLTHLSQIRIINVNHPQPCLYLRKCLLFSVQFSLCVHSALQSVSMSFLSIIYDILLSCLSTTSMCCSFYLRHLCKYPGLLNFKSKVSKPHNVLKPLLYFLPFLVSFYFSGSHCHKWTSAFGSCNFTTKITFINLIGGFLIKTTNIFQTQARLFLQALTIPDLWNPSFPWLSSLGLSC